MSPLRMYRCFCNNARGSLLNEMQRTPYQVDWCRATCARSSASSWSMANA